MTRWHWLVAIQSAILGLLALYTLAQAVYKAGHTAGVQECIEYFIPAPSQSPSPVVPR